MFLGVGLAFRILSTISEIVLKNKQVDAIVVVSAVHFVFLGPRHAKTQQIVKGPKYSREQNILVSSGFW